MGRYAHMTPVLRQLHWLPIEARAQFKVLIMAYKALNGLGPGYLNERLRPYMPDRPLRSAGESLLREPSMKEIRRIDKYAQRDLKKGLHLYGTDGNIGLTNAWSIIQTDFRCCGVSNYTDWFDVYNTTRVPDSCCLEFSENCGLHSPGTWWKAPCYETVKIWLQENLLAVGIFGLCTALVQILGLTFAMTMYCQVVKADTYCA
ncbi:Tetraspanin-4 [Varanus komodoensis]|nr:Tetraspanin-4 [Varanus komodoensis]